MTKRHPSLVPLTHDHHHTLAHARRLKEVRSVDASALRRAGDDFVNFYLGRVRHHFHEEEELFFAPLVEDENVGPLIVRAVADHLRLHAQVRALGRQLSVGDVEPALLHEIAALLESHVRFEEKELFPLIEEGIHESELIDLSTSGRTRHLSTGPGVLRPGQR